ncbi:hypothetical protein [Hyphomicrobium sp. 1Nfss2.1]
MTQSPAKITAILRDSPHYKDYLAKVPNLADRMAFVVEALEVA